MKKDQEKKSNSLDRIKYIGWCMSQLPPTEAGFSFSDFIQYAKFQLSVEKGVLMKDPIWEQYTDEELLAEYYGNLFEKNEDARKEFEAMMGSGDDDEFLEWAANKEKESREEEQDAEKDKAEDLEYSPDELGE